MKKIIFITLSLLFIWWIIFIKFFMMNNNIDIEKIKESIVVIVPQIELNSCGYNTNWIIEDFKESGVWAWFFIDTNWTIQTVNHLVEDDNIKYKVIYKNNEYDAKIISRNKEKDLATIKIITNERVLFPRLIKEGARGWSNEIYSFWVNMNDLSITYNTWTIINKKSKIDNMSNLLEISNNIKQWFSWWPIIDSKWNLIWINYAISNWKKYWINID